MSGSESDPFGFTTGFGGPAAAPPSSLPIARRAESTPLPQPSVVPPVAAPAPAAPRRGLRTSRAGLIAALAVSALIGLCAYQSLATIDVVRLRVGTAIGWGIALALVSVLVVGALVLAIVGVVRARGGLVGVLGIACAVLLPPVSLLLGIQLGWHTLSTHLSADLDAGRGAGLEVLSQWSDEHGVDLGPVLSWLANRS